MKGISVVICCYNSASRILLCLDHLNRSVADFPWEVVVINNNSTDNTVQLVEQFFSEHTAFPGRLVSENAPGQANARKRGVLEAAYDYVLYCDDDNHLAPDYLKIAFQLLDEDASKGVLGANISLYPNSFPEWFEKYRGMFAAVSYGPEPRYMDFVYGAGMVLRKNLLTKLLQHPDFAFLLAGRTGKKVTSGDDSELCILYREAGYKIYYDPGLKLVHDIDVSRLNREYLHKLTGGISRSLLVFDMYASKAKNFAAYFASRQVKYLGSFIKGVNFLFYQRLFKGEINYYTFFLLYPAMELYHIPNAARLFRQSLKNRLLARSIGR